MAATFACTGAQAVALKGLVILKWFIQPKRYQYESFCIGSILYIGVYQNTTDTSDSHATLACTGVQTVGLKLLIYLQMVYSINYLLNRGFQNTNDNSIFMYWGPDNRHKGTKSQFSLFTRKDTILYRWIILIWIITNYLNLTHNLDTPSPFAFGVKQSITLTRKKRIYRLLSASTQEFWCYSARTHHFIVPNSPMDMPLPPVTLKEIPHLQISPGNRISTLRLMSGIPDTLESLRFWANFKGISRFDFTGYINTTMHYYNHNVKIKEFYF